VLGSWGELEYVGPAREWDEEVVRGSHAEGSFTTWYLKDRALKAALTFGRSEDLDHARRLITDGTALTDDERAMLGDPDSELAALRP
jgi:3-phenylpropionate/trans-cinnamate dioxygenase ferredoxin reductase subunit